MGGFFRPSDQYTSPDYHDLLVRWFQFGAFTPLYRVHGGGSNTEPWNYNGDVMPLLNATNNLRYRFLPYTYSGFARCAVDGYTMQRAMVMDFGIGMSKVADQFMWGDNVLVAPITTKADTMQSLEMSFFPHWKMAPGQIFGPVAWHRPVVSTALLLLQLPLTQVPCSSRVVLSCSWVQ